MNRIYDHLLSEHFRDNRQMAFVAGPRQTGKTTLAKLLSTKYLNWDNQKNRTAIIQGADAVASYLDLNNGAMHLTPWHTICSVCGWKIIHVRLMNLETDLLLMKPVLNI